MGFPFRQSYKQTTTRQIELRLADGSRMKLNVNVELDDIDYSKQHRAFAPNIIHAMDATHKSLVANRLFKKYGITEFNMIHDSFGTHFGNMDLLFKETKEAFLEMYQGKNFMEFLYSNFKSQGIKMKRYVRTENGQKIKDGKGGFLIEDIPLEEVKDLGDYDFKDFEKLEYFFH
jgi:DNA-directed RNA polymerase